MGNNMIQEKDIKTPFLNDFSSLSDDVKQKLEDLAEEWKRTEQSTGERNRITSNVKKDYPKDTLEYQYFTFCKQTKVKSKKTFKKKSNFFTEESQQREQFAQLLRIFIQKNLVNNSYIDLSLEDKGIFVVDENFNLPQYFWMRLYNDVLPVVVKDEKFKKHAWGLLIACLNKNDDELKKRLQNTRFANMNHIINSILQFFKNNLLSTYKEVVSELYKQKIKQEVIDKNEIIITQQEAEKREQQKEQQRLEQVKITKKKKKKIDYSEFL